MEQCLVIVALISGCGSDAPDPIPVPIGEVTVNVRTNAVRGGEAPQGPRPLAGAFVFTDDGLEAVQTDAEGNATVAVSRTASTIHVLAENLGGFSRTLYSVVDVPVGAQVAVGGRPVDLSVGQKSVTLPTLGGATAYELRGPHTCIDGGGEPSTSPGFTFTHQFCALTGMHFYGFATTATTTQYVEADVELGSGEPAQFGPYLDLSSYTLALTGLPETGAATVQLASQVGGVYLTALTEPVEATGAMATVAAPPTADTLVVRQPGSTWVSRGTVQPGANPVDAAPMLPVPDLPSRAGATLTWSYDAGGRDVDNVVIEASVDGGSVKWIAHGAPTSTQVTFPALPGEVADATHEIAPSRMIVLGITGDRRLDLDGLYDGWLDLDALPDNEIAFATNP